VAPVPWSPWPIRSLHPRWRRYAENPRTALDGPVRVERPRWLAMPGSPPWLATDRQVEALARGTWHGRRPAVVHGHFATPHGQAAVRLGHHWRRPTVVTLHGSDVNLQPQARRGGRARLQAVVDGATEVLAVSSALAERTTLLTGRRPRVMPVGVDLEPLRAARRPLGEARERVGWPADRSVVTFVGRLLPAKGLRELAAAADRLPKEALIMVIGDGPLHKELAASAAARSDRLRLLGPIDHGHIPDLLAASDVVVLPSHAEGLPTVLVEAGAMGIPVVGSAVGGVPELLGADGGWLCPPRGPEALTATIRRVLDDPAEAARRSANLERTVAEEHDVDRQAAKLVALYRSLVA
jgi:teichuronic acid biosynthesis glycosyltransferase TuaC